MRSRLFENARAVTAKAILVGIGRLVGAKGTKTPVANDHYIPQCLTRPWHDTAIGKQSLRFFDFETGTYDHRNSEKLFARSNINTAETEAYLNKYIETPFAVVQDKIDAAGADMEKAQAAFDSLPHTALTGLYWLQVQRIMDAKGTRTEHHLDEFARKGFTWLEGLSAVVFEKFEPLLYVVRTVLYFPESAIFMIPLAGQMPAIALPIHTHLALVFADKTTSRTALDKWMADNFMPSAFSLGLNARRVVIPPELPNPKPESLVSTRAKVRELFQLTSEAAAVAGIPVWKLNDS